MSMPQSLPRLSPSMPWPAAAYEHINNTATCTVCYYNNILEKSFVNGQGCEYWEIVATLLNFHKFAVAC